MEDLALQVSPEAATSVLSEKKFLEIAQSSQKKTCARVFLNKVAGLRPVGLLKKRLLHRCFPVNFVKLLTEHLLVTACLCNLIPLVRFFQCLKYAYVVNILVFLDLIRFVCFYDLMNRGLFRTLSNIQVGAF